jgi:hypothetical protein
VEAPAQSAPIQGEAELQALQDLLFELFPPQDWMMCVALLNTLVMEGEQPHPRPWVIEGLVQTMASLGGKNEMLEGLVLQQVRPLLQALALPARPAGETRCSYSFGPEMCRQVMHLRNTVGLSKQMVYRNLQFMGIRMPGDAAMQCISSLPSAFEMIQMLTGNVE